MGLVFLVVQFRTHCKTGFRVAVASPRCHSDSGFGHPPGDRQRNLLLLATPREEKQIPRSHPGVPGPGQAARDDISRVLAHYSNGEDALPLPASY